jgi:DNA-binding response OmpR family regulator
MHLRKIEIKVLRIDA